MTGVAADADELVQETFLRAIEQAPHARSQEVLPWLRKVAIHAACDLLRRRKVRGYHGAWLPSPVELDDLPDEGAPTSAYYGQRESLSYAFLIALEVLTPEQRSVVILRDVLDYSVKETASVLALSEANVKTTHHRARAALSTYDSDRRPPNPRNEAIARAAMLRFFACVASGDIHAVERLFARSVTGLHDSDREFFVAGRPLVSARQIARFMVHVAPKTRVIGCSAAMFNGLPGLLARTTPYIPGAPSCTANLFDVNAQGLVRGTYVVVATHKLRHLPLFKLPA